MPSRAALALSAGALGAGALTAKSWVQPVGSRGWQLTIGRVHQSPISATGWSKIEVRGAELGSDSEGDRQHSRG